MTKQQGCGYGLVEGKKCGIDKTTNPCQGWF